MLGALWTIEYLDNPRYRSKKYCERRCFTLASSPDVLLKTYIGDDE